MTTNGSHIRLDLPPKPLVFIFYRADPPPRYWPPRDTECTRCLQYLSCRSLSFSLPKCEEARQRTPLGQLAVGPNGYVNHWWSLLALAMDLPLETTGALRLSELFDPTLVDLP
jgi:hypothetical protein